MIATKGDHIVVQSRRVDVPTRDCEVLEVRGEGGQPPYVVQWAEDGHVGLFFPGPDAHVETTAQ